MEQNKIVGLHKDKHAKIKVNGVRPFSHIAEEHMLPVVVHEFVAAGGELPIVFIKDPDSGRYQPVVLLGLASKQNLMLEQDKWQISYIPRVVRNYPLVLMQDAPNSDRLIVGMDEASERINETEGFALFNDDGSESEFLANRKQQLGEYVEMAQVTQAFVEKLTSLGLIKEQVLTITINDDKRNINGVHMIDDKKLNELSDEAFLELRKLGYLTAIYAHLMSLQHTHTLIQKLAQREEAARAQA